MDLLTHADGSLNWELVSPAIIGVTAFVLIGLEHVFPYDRGQKLFRKGWFTDFFWYTLLQSYVLGVLIKALAEIIDRKTGRPGWVAHWPLWQQTLVFLFVHDFYIYWFHRAQHRFPILWRIHEAHHSVRNVDWLAGSRSHALEIMINQSIEFLPIMLFGAPEMFLIKGTIDAVWGMYIHSNIDVRSGPLQYVINGPEMHRWHHSAEYIGYGMNYGTKFAFWDYLFGTAHRPNYKPPGYGLTEPFPEGFPDGFFPQFLYAFRRFKPAAQTATPAQAKPIVNAAQAIE